MPAITHDGRSFMIDGRRVWIASGRIPYARLPREVWAERILAAKNAGLNTIETSVVWSRHEPRAGRFDFTGDNDLRHFIDLVGKAGMFCILGLGPYVGAEYDFGGLPAFLRENPTVQFRTNNPAYLEACSRFLGAVADQIRGWQVTAPGTGGPIILLTCESEWTCGDEKVATAYLGELTRYIRESGLSVPIVNSNNLWQSVEGQVDGWAGSTNMLAMVRQLAAVRAGQPRIVIDFATGAQPTWGSQPGAVMSPRSVERRLAEVLAGGGQFNVSTFCGGTNFGFLGGRTDDGPATFATAGADHGCAIDQLGVLSDRYASVKRVGLFASRFGRVLAALDPAFRPVCELPPPPVASGEATTARKSTRRGVPREAQAQSVSVVHASGTQGSVAFIFGPEEEPQTPLKTTLLLADGTELEVPLGTQPVAWCLLDVNVSPRCHVDFANVSVLGTTHSGTQGAGMGGVAVTANGAGAPPAAVNAPLAGSAVLAAFGPAGEQAVISVNGSPVEARVPTDATPAVLSHEGLVIVLVRREDVPTLSIGDEAVYVGVAGLSASGEPIAPDGAKTYLRIGLDAKPRAIAFEAPKQARPARSTGPVTLSKWTRADQLEYVRGESPRFASIAQLKGLAALGSPSGYGWYRLTLENPRAGSALLDFGTGGDRLHVFDNGKFSALVGVGPGSQVQAPLVLRSGEQTLVILAENLGRFASGMNLGEPKGLVDEVFLVEKASLGKGSVRPGTPVPLLAFRSPLWDVSEADSTSPERLAWKIKAQPKDRLLLRVSTPPRAGLLLLNDKPFAYLDRSGPACVMLPPELLGKGGALLELTLVQGDDTQGELDRVGKGLALFRVAGNLSERCDLAFAKWEPPPESAFGPAGSSASGVPSWLRCTFEAPAGRPLMFEPIGLTKGQFLVNGKHVGRYFVSTRAGKPVPPQTRYMIPAGWLRPAGEPNDLLVFDEHGASPSRVKLGR